MTDHVAKLRVSRLKELHALLTSLGESNVVIDVTADGWGICFNDPAHIAMLAVLVGRAAFESYECDEDFRAALNLEKVKNALSVSSSKDVAELTLNPAAMRYRCGNLDWIIRLADQEPNRPKLPTWDGTKDVTVPLDDLKTVAKAAAYVSDHIMFTLAGERLTMRTMSEQDEQEMNLAVPFREGSVASLIPLDYFQSCVAALPQDSATMDIGNDRPLRINIDAWDGAMKGQYLIAPRVESEG